MKALLKIPLIMIAVVIVLLAGLKFLPGDDAGVNRERAGEPGARAAAPARPEEKIAPNLRLEGPAAPPAGAAVVVNVALEPAAGAGEFARSVTGLGGRVLARGAGDSEYVRVELPAGMVEQVAAMPQVKFVEKYEPPELLNDRAANITGARPLGAPGLVLPGGITGRGQLVAVADSGLDTGTVAGLHPDFRGRVKALEAVYDGASTRDATGHGTHVAGTVAGSGAASGGKYRGMAPGAELYIQSIMDAGGDPVTPVDLRQLFAPAYKAGARIHLNSWGGQSNNYLSSSAQVDEFVREHPDFLVLFGAGNSGPDRGTVSPEANSKNALVVGAVENPRPGLGRDADDPGQVAGLSSRGPAGDGRIKPELVAPGTAVISTASTQSEDDYALDKYYTRKSGTSMAAAVVAGAAALLREYLATAENAKDPSAALLRAALVNGAARLDGDPAAAGFGRLDVLNTVLALREDTMLFVDSRAGVAQDGHQRYTINVPEGHAPFKATLVWTDPPAEPGADKALVNDLDLVVTGPGGQLYYGNDFQQRRSPDRVNNIEQVYIPDPRPGKYIVQVIGYDVNRNAVQGGGTGVPAQDYAVVYGTPLEHGVAARANQAGDQVLLDDGGIMVVDEDAPLKVAAGGPADGDGGGGDGVIKTGADLFFKGSARRPQTVYASYYTDTLRGVKGVVLDGGGYLAGSAAGAGGGYNLAPGEPGPLLTVNGKETENPGDIVSGSDAVVTVNPSSGLVWRADAGYRRLEGYLSGVDRQKLELRGYDEQFPLDPGVVINQHVRWLEQPDYWAPFSYAPPGTLAGLSPGDRVTVVVSPASGRVTAIEYNREMLAGVLEGCDAAGTRVTLAGGKVYGLAPGVEITRDGREAGAGDLRRGDHLEALLLPDSNTIWSIEAYSGVLFGRVVFYNEVSGSLLLFGGNGQYVMYSMYGDAPVYWQGREMGPAAVREGDYVRLAVDREGRVWRVDVAVPAGETGMEAEFAGYDPVSGYLEVRGGARYRVTTRTAVLKNGVPVLPQDLIKGEKITVCAVVSAVDDEKILGMVQAGDAGAAGPELALAAPSYVEAPEVTISGSTVDGARVRLSVNGGPPAELEVRGGAFNRVVPLTVEGNNTVTVVAVDPRTGGVTSREAVVYWAGSRGDPADLEGHWAEDEIRQFVARGVVVGYPDGLFRPDRPVSRVEFARMLAGAMGWKTGGETANGLPFADAGDIRPGDRPYVELAAARGVVRGYPGDNTFRPDRPITRAEMAVMVYRAMAGQAPNNLAPAGNREGLTGDRLAEIPAWARKAALYMWDAGIMTGRGDGGFSPSARATRAEAVVVLARATRVH